MRQFVVALLVAVMAAAVLGAVLAPMADGAGRGRCLETRGKVDPVTGQTTYVCVRYAPGNPGDGGDGGDDGGRAEPTCDLVAPYTFCMGTDACSYEAWGTPWAVPAGDKPSPDAEMRVRSCRSPDGGILTLPVWVGADGAPPEPPLADQAVEALGNLDLPRGTLAFNPENRTIVGLETWIWLEDVDTEEVTGSSAFGLVAIATPERVVFDSGEAGAGRDTTVTCPVVTSPAQAEDRCEYSYATSSVRGTGRAGGLPAFVATAHVEYSIQFEDGGVPVEVDVPGTDLDAVEGPEAQANIPVAEVQGVVEG
jgi:hypothetical protein